MVIDGVFASDPADGVIFHAATGLDEPAFAAVQERVRGRLLRVFVRRGLLPADAARAMAQWALLLARIYDRRKSLWDELFPLLCPKCGGEIRIIAFITDPSTVRDLLAQLGEPIAPPRIAPARGPPLWAAAGAEHDPFPDPALQRTPAYEYDQRLTW